jgi:hypothetical protein
MSLLVINPIMSSAAGQSAMPGKIALPEQPLPQLTEEDLEAMMKMLETMDDETLDALAKIGENFIKEAEAQGKDPFELLGFPIEPENNEQITSSEGEEKIRPEAPEAEPIKEIKVPQADTHQIREARTMLKNITDDIAAIRIKAEEERETRDKLAPLKYLLDDLVYYLHTLNQDKLLKYLTDKEFKKLYEALIQLETELNYLEPLFELPEVTLEGVNPYTILGIARGASWAEVNEAYQKLLLEKDPRNIEKKLEETGMTENKREKALQKAQTEYETISEAYSAILKREQALQALDRIIDSLVRAAYQQNVITEVQKLLSKYEPEALKIKKEQEELEKKARKEQEEALRRRPAYAPVVFEPFPYFGESYVPTYEDTYITPTPTEPSLPTSTSAPSMPSNAKPGITGAPGKAPKEEKKKAVPEKKGKGKAEAANPKVGKKLDIIEKELEAITHFIDSGPEVGGKPAKELFQSFGDYLSKSIDLPYSADNPEIIKAKEVNKELPELTKRFNTIKRELRGPTLTKFEREELRRKAKRLWDQDYEVHLKKIDSLLFSNLKAKASPEKRFLFFGDEEALNDIKGKGKGEAQQEDKEARIKFLKSIGSGNLLENFIDAYQNLTKELNLHR